METLQSRVEKVAEKILAIILKNVTKKLASDGDIIGHENEVGILCCIYKHYRDINRNDHWVDSLKYDVIRMLIRGTDYSHSLCLHVCDGSSEFHVYSKKSWLSFCPEQGALVITAGDQIQVILHFCFLFLHNSDSISTKQKTPSPLLFETRTIIDLKINKTNLLMLVCQYFDNTFNLS